MTEMVEIYPTTTEQVNEIDGWLKASTKSQVVVNRGDVRGLEEETVATYNVEGEHGIMRDMGVSLTGDSLRFLFEDPKEAVAFKLAWA